MHYANGQEAKPGDLVIHHEGHQQFAGVLTSATSGCETCNGNIHPVARRVKSTAGWGPWLPITSPHDWRATISQCLPVDFDSLTQRGQRPLIPAPENEAAVC